MLLAVKSSGNSILIYTLPSLVAGIWVRDLGFAANMLSRSIPVRLDDIFIFSVREVPVSSFTGKANTATSLQKLYWLTGASSLPSKRRPPSIRSSLAASLFMPVSLVIHGPPATNPLEICISKVSPNL